MDSLKRDFIGIYNEVETNKLENLDITKINQSISILMNEAQDK